MSTMRVKGKAQFRARQIVKADWKLSSRKVPAGTVSYLGGVLGWYYVEKFVPPRRLAVECVARSGQEIGI